MKAVLVARSGHPTAPKEGRRPTFLPVILAGLATEIVYFAATVGPLSFLQHGRVLTDLGKLTSSSPTAAAIVLVSLVALFAFYGVALRRIAASGEHATRLALLGTAIFSLTLVFIYPATAIDIYNYAVQGHVAVFQHLNPLVTPPAQAKSDPFVQYGGTWANSTSPYGPVWIFLTEADALVAGNNIINAVLGLKAVAAIAVVGTAGLLAWFQRSEGSRASRAVVFFGWNPLVQLELVGNGHNDAVLTLLLIAGLIAMKKDRPVLGAIGFTLSLLVKSLAVGVLPLLFIQMLRMPGRTIRNRLLITIVSALTVVGMAVLAYAPFWAGSTTLDRIQAVDSNYLGSLSALAILLIPNSIHWLIYPRVAILGVVGISLVFLVWTRRTPLERAVFEIIFVTILMATHFAGWYLPVLVAVAALAGDGWSQARMIAFTFAATLTTPIWEYAWSWSQGRLSMEEFHLIVVPLVFVPTLGVTLLALWHMVKQRQNQLDGPQNYWGDIRHLVAQLACLQ